MPSPEMQALKAENALTPEAVLEAPLAKTEVRVEKKAEGRLGEGVGGVAVTASKAISVKTPEFQKVEKVLEDGVAPFYEKMPRNLRISFKAKGEEVAREIEEILKSVKVQANKILQLIISWLKMIPGVNRFFIEQEAKIKTDKILLLKKEFDRKKFVAI